MVGRPYVITVSLKVREEMGFFFLSIRFRGKRNIFVYGDGLSSKLSGTHTHTLESGRRRATGGIITMLGHQKRSTPEILFCNSPSNHEQFIVFYARFDAFFFFVRVIKND